MADAKAIAGKIGRLARNVAGVKKRRVLVGINDINGQQRYPAPEGSDPGAATPTLHDVAVWSEYGTATAPPRPFLGNSKPELAAMYRKAVGEAVNKYVSRGLPVPPKWYGRVGLAAQAIVQNKIAEGGFAPNAPATLARKGADKPPLTDTGLLRANITYEIVEAR